MSEEDIFSSCPDCGSRSIQEHISVRIVYNDRGQEIGRKHYGEPLYFCNECSRELTLEQATKIIDSWDSKYSCKRCGRKYPEGIIDITICPFCGHKEDTYF